MLGELWYVNAVNDNISAIDRVYSRDHIEHCGFTRAVASDNGYEVSVVEVKVYTLQRLFLINRTGVKCFFYVYDVKHLSCPLWSF